MTLETGIHYAVSENAQKMEIQYLIFIYRNGRNMVLQNTKYGSFPKYKGDLIYQDIQR